MRQKCNNQIEGIKKPLATSFVTQENFVGLGTEKFNWKKSMRERREQ